MSQLCKTYRAAGPRRCGPDPCAPKPGLLWPVNIPSPFWTRQRVVARRALKRSGFGAPCVTYRSAQKPVGNFCPFFDSDTNDGNNVFLLHVENVNCSCDGPDSPTRLRIADSRIAEMEFAWPDNALLLLPGTAGILTVPQLRSYLAALKATPEQVAITVVLNNQATLSYRGICIDGRALSYSFSLLEPAGGQCESLKD